MISDGLAGNRAAWELTLWSPRVMKCMREGERKGRREEGRKKKQTERNAPFRHWHPFGNSLLDGWFSWGSRGPALGLCAQRSVALQVHIWRKLVPWKHCIITASGLSDRVHAGLLKETLTLSLTFIKKINLTSCLLGMSVLLEILKLVLSVF